MAEATQVWTEAALPDQDGRVVVVTGANSGLGLQTSRALAIRGARVVMACRSPERAEEAARSILAVRPDARLDLVQLDLADLDNVRGFPSRLPSDIDAIDVLVNNAGIMAIPRGSTAQGHEMQLGTNHLGHFALTAVLADRLFRKEGSRLVTVSSGMHWLGDLHLEDLMLRRAYGKWRAYNQSKLANLLFHHELASRLAERRHRTLAVAAHPGLSATHLQQVGVDQDPTLLNRFINGFLNRFFAQPASWGALPSLFAATDPGAVHGAYYGPMFEGWGWPRRTLSSPRSWDLDLRARLWAESVRLTGLDPCP